MRSMIVFINKSFNCFIFPCGWFYEESKGNEKRWRDDNESWNWKFTSQFFRIISYCFLNHQHPAWVLVVGGRVKINTKALPNCNPLYLPKGFKEFIIFGLFWQRNLFLSTEYVRRWLFVSTTWWTAAGISLAWKSWFELFFNCVVFMFVRK